MSHNIASIISMKSGDDDDLNQNVSHFNLALSWLEIEWSATTLENVHGMHLKTPNMFYVTPKHIKLLH